MPVPDARAAGRTAGRRAGPGRLPDERARAVFNAFRLGIRYDRGTADCRATLTGETLPAAVIAANEDFAAICAVPPTGFEPVLPP